MYCRRYSFKHPKILCLTIIFQCLKRANIIVDNCKMKSLIGITFPVWTFCTIFMMLDLPVEMGATQSTTTADFVHVTKARMQTKYNCCKMNNTISLTFSNQFVDAALR